MTPLSLFLLISTIARAQDTPGCANARLDDGFVVADCVDDETGNPFLYIDVEKKFKSSFENPTPSDIDISDAIFASWTSADSRNTSKPSGPLRQRSDTDSFHTAHEFISLDDLRAAEEGRAGMAGGVLVQAAARTNLRSRRACDSRHPIKIAYQVAFQSFVWGTGIFSLQLGIRQMMKSSKDGNAKRDVCSEVHNEFFDGRYCASWAKGDAMYYDEKAVKEAIEDCVSQCVVNKLSCQRSWATKTQQHNCKSWWHWWGDKCGIEEHVNNFCISDRPKGCTINKALNVDVPDPE